MLPLRCAYILALLLTSVAAVNAQTDKPFPTDDEINLLLSGRPLDRAITNP